MSNKLRRLFHEFTGDYMMFKVAVGLGKVPGYRIFRKFGMNDDVPASGTEYMWPPGTPRVLPTSVGVCSVSSTAAADDVAGTGAQTVTIEGLDANYDEISETVDMDGVTPVNTTASFLRVNRAFVATAGSGAENAGDISISIGGNLQAFIEDTEGQTHQTLYTVPAGHYLVIDLYTVGVGRMAGTSDCQIEGKVMIDGTNAWRSISDIYKYNGGQHSNAASVTVIPPKTELIMTVASTATTQAFGVFGGLLVNIAYID